MIWPVLAALIVVSSQVVRGDIELGQVTIFDGQITAEMMIVSSVEGLAKSPIADTSVFLNPNFPIFVKLFPEPPNVGDDCDALQKLAVIEAYLAAAEATADGLVDSLNACLLQTNQIVDVLENLLDAAGVPPPDFQVCKPALIFFQMPVIDIPSFTCYRCLSGMSNINSRLTALRDYYAACKVVRQQAVALLGKAFVLINTLPPGANQPVLRCDRVFIPRMREELTAYQSMSVHARAGFDANAALCNEELLVSQCESCGPKRLSIFTEVAVTLQLLKSDGAVQAPESGPLVEALVRTLREQARRVHDRELQEQVRSIVRRLVAAERRGKVRSIAYAVDTPQSGMMIALRSLEVDEEACAAEVVILTALGDDGRLPTPNTADELAILESFKVFRSALAPAGPTLPPRDEIPTLAEVRALIRELRER